MARVRDYLRQYRQYRDPVPVDTPPPMPGYIVRSHAPERLEYEGPIIVHGEDGASYVAMADRPDLEEDLAMAIYELIDPMTEDGVRWQEVDVYARIVVEILPDPRPDVLTDDVDAPNTRE